MRFIESDDWLTFAVGLWNDSLSETLLDPPSLVLYGTDAHLRPDISSSDIDDLIRLVSEGDVIERTAAVRLLVKAAIARDARLGERRDEVTQAFAALVEREHAQTTASVWALQGWIELAPRQADDFLTRRLTIDDIRVGMSSEAPFTIVSEASASAVSGVSLIVEAIDNEGRTCRFVRPLTSALIAAWARQESASFRRQPDARSPFHEPVVALEHATIEWGDDVRLSVSIDTPEVKDRPYSSEVVRLAGMRTPVTLYWIPGYSDGAYDLGVELRRPVSNDPGALVDAANDRPWHKGWLKLRRLAKMVMCPAFGRIDDRCEPIVCTPQRNARP